MLDTAADQFEVSERILKDLPLFDPMLALSFAEMLNTVTRRDYGIQEVLVAYVKQDNLSINEDFLNKGVSSIKDDRIKEQTILRLIDTAKKYNKLNNSAINNFSLHAIQLIHDPIILCKSIAYILSKQKYENDPQNFDHLFSMMINAWEKIEIIWMRVEAAFDLASIIAEGGSSCAEELYERGRALRNSLPLAYQSIGVMFYETLRLASRVVGKLNLSNENSLRAWENLIKTIEYIPSSLLRSLLFAQLALRRLKSGDKLRFDALIQDRVILNLQALPPSDLKNKIIADLALSIYEYSSVEAKYWIDKLPYSIRNFAWSQIAIKIITNASLFDEFDEDAPNLQLDIANANKVIQILEFIERDGNFTLVGELFTKAIADSSKLNEQSKLDFLTKLGDIVSKKLPDNMNIHHNGYKVVLESQIEVAIRKSAKKTRAKIRKKHLQIISEAREIENIADRIFVMATVAEEFRDIEKDIAERLMKEACDNVNQIPNLKDRADRLQLIAKGFSKLNKTDESYEAIRMAKQIAMNLYGYDRDTLLAAVIQTAHQIDKDLGEKITEKIEDQTVQYNLDSNIKAAEIAKSPHKLFSSYSEWKNDNEVMRIAARKMSRSIASGRSVSYSKKQIIEWLSTTKFLDFSATKEIVDWAIEASLRQVPESSSDNLAVQIINSLIANCEILYDIGANLSSLSVIPESLKIGFQGLSTQKKFFRVGERDKVLEYISTWLQNNAQESVMICDPYFDKEQLWILKSIPIDLEVKVICTGIKFGLHPTESDLIEPLVVIREKQRNEKRRIKGILDHTWQEISDQTPPPTLFVIHGTVFDTEEKDAFHDRYIITKNAGLSIGTSLNGLGKKEFFITILTQDDVIYVNENYIFPKINIQDQFSKVIYFELED